MIPGVINYELLARAYAPKTRDELLRAVKRLRFEGLGDHEIAARTALHVESVRRILAERT